MECYVFKNERTRLRDATDYFMFYFMFNMHIVLQSTVDGQPGGPGEHALSVVLMEHITDQGAALILHLHMEGTPAVEMPTHLVVVTMDHAQV